MGQLLALPQRYPRSTLLLIVLLTVFFAVFGASVRFDSSADNLLPLGDPERTYYNEVREQFGSEEITVIGLFADDVFTTSTLAKIDRMSKKIEELEGVKEVVSLTTVKGVEMTDFGLTVGPVMKELPETPEEVASFRQRLMSNPIYIKNVVGADAKAAGLSVFFDPLSDQQFESLGLEDKIRAIAEEFRGPEEIAITGVPTLKVFGARFLKNDLLKFLPLSALIVTLVLAWTYRTARGVLIPLSTVGVGVVWTAGLMVMTDTPINLGTVILPPLLMAIGVAYAIHMMSRYYQELDDEKPLDEIISSTMEHVRLPVFVAALTTLAGFITFTFMPIRAIREFGIFSSFGLTATLIGAFTILPAALMLLKRESPPQQTEGEPNWLERALAKCGWLAVHRRNAVLAVGAIICALSIWGATRVRVETDFLGFFDPEGEIRRENAQISAHLAGTQAISIIIDGGSPQMATRLETMEGIRDLQAYVNTLPGVDKSISIVDFLEQLRHVLDPEAEPFPKTQAEIEQLLILVSPEDIRSMLNADASRANLLVRTTLSGSEEVKDFVQKVSAFGEERFARGVLVKPTGTVVLLNRSADALAAGQITGLWQVFVVLLILMCIMFLSIRVGLLSLIPNVVPIVILFGIMGWAGIDLNISTALIAAMAIGIAIDDTIHYLATFSGELRKTGEQSSAMLNATHVVGVPMVVTSVSLAFGFLIVCLSNFQPVRDFGLMSSITMGIALGSDLFITPAVLMTTNVITIWDLLYLKLGRDPQKQIPLFHGLRGFQAKIVVLMAKLAAAERGTLITREGEVKEEMYVLLAGNADVRRRGSDRTLMTLKRGDVFGEMGLVRKQPRSADVVAAEDVEYLVLDDAFLQRIRRRYPRIGNTVLYNLTRILSDRLDSTSGRLAAAAPQPASTEAHKTEEVA